MHRAEAGVPRKIRPIEMADEILRSLILGVVEGEDWSYYVVVR
jgi:hypothetical protein